MRKKEQELTKKQHAFIHAMLTKKSIATAARASAVSESTARRWLRLPAVARAYEQAQNELFTEGLSALKSVVGKASATLARHLDNKGTAPSVQVRAAQIILEQAINVHRVIELEQRLAALEEALNTGEVKHEKPTIIVQSD